MTSWIEEFRKSREKGTGDHYAGIVKRFLQEVEEPVSQRSVSDWIRQQGVSSRTQENYYHAIRSYYKYGMSREYCSNNPVWGFYWAPEWKRVKPSRSMSEYHVKEMIKWAPERYKRLLWVLYRFGLRVSEGLGLRGRNVWVERWILEVWGKGKKQRLLRIPRDMRVMMEEEKKRAGEEGKLYPWHRATIFRVIKRAGSKIGRGDVSPHSLRHSFATHLWERGASLEEIQKALGHATREMTVRYISTMNESEERDIGVADGTEYLV